ncbi:hypothetical protein ACF08N_01360 [Streptomyces sp. NPDC015127]|uniref:hypothetical protein n=1 Tax=Streptomyces sp. NPDC015127 TaxID=3364939 RepID=UPI0036FBDF5E
MKTAGHWRVALALLPALIGTAACGTGGTPEAGEAVYGRPLAEQFRAATEVTQQAGTARFVSTLTYSTPDAEAVHRTTGSQDYAGRTSDVTLTLRVPTDFPEGAAKFLGEPGKSIQQILATTADDVYFRRDASSWLRYTPGAFNKLGDPTSELAAHAAGEAAPYSGTLADLVPRTIPREQPKREADGSRVYQVTALQEMAAELLPPALRVAGNDWGSAPVEMTVRLNAEVRLTAVRADLGPVLESLHKHKILVGVTRLHASYSLSDFGAPLQHETPSRGVEDAEKVLAPLGTLKGGQCAAFDTGLAARTVVRPVDCAHRPDIRVYAQVSVDRAFPGQKALTDGREYAREQCDEAYTDAPKHWVRDTRRPGRYAFAGSSSVSVHHGAEGTKTLLTGDYTCYVITPGSGK